MYKTIAIYETQLQKRTINYFIKNNVIDKDELLIIDATGHEVKLMGQTIKLNFNKFSLTFDSLKNVKELSKLNLKCETLLSTHFTGINSLFFSSFVKCNNKILIDDGIGTPVLLLDNNLYNRLIRFQVRFFLIKLALKLFYNIKLLTVQKSINDFQKYYSIYNLNHLFKNRLFDFKYIDGVNKKLKLLPNTIGFIGSPMVKFNLVSKKRFKQFLCKILNGEGPFTYYLHPDEKKINSYIANGITFVKPNNFIEEYFDKNGVPEILYSFSSSSVLNIASVNPEVKILNISFSSFFRNKSKVYSQVLNELNISESKYKL